MLQRRRMMKVRVSAVLALVVFVFGAATLQAAKKTLTGEVGDAMCGVKHMIKDGVSCTAACVSKGSDYALIVKDKAYTLKADEKLKADLAKLAGKTASVTGDLNGTTMMVTSVKAVTQSQSNSSSSGSSGPGDISPSAGGGGGGATY
jgi:hypothetical protein